MKENRILSTDTARYRMVDFDGTNASGIAAVGDYVLVKIDRAASTAGKSGSILLPDAKVETMDHAVQTGIIVAQGPDAFFWNGDRTRQWQGDKPEVGNRILFRRYAGEYVKGIKDPETMYRMMSDKEVIGIVSTED